MAYVRSASLDGLFDDLLKAGAGVVSDTTKTVTGDVAGRGGDIAQQLINSSQFKVVLDKVEERATTGVKKEAGKNALALCLIAAGAGTIGGAVLKGKLGMVGCVALVGLGVGWIVTNSKPAK